MTKEKKSTQTMLEALIERNPNVNFKTIWQKDLFDKGDDVTLHEITVFYHDLKEETNESFRGLEMGDCYDKAFKFFEKENEIQRLKNEQKKTK